MGSPPEARSPLAGGIPTPVVRHQLERILTSEVFSRSDRLSAFLRFVVEETLAGRGHTLKEPVLAAELYRKRPGSSTDDDPVVRVDARRLRDKLREYYAEAGRELVIISLPKGSYTPEAVAFYGTPAFQTGALSIGSPGGPIPIKISPDPNDPEVQAISAFLRVLNALENIRSSINVAERGRRMSKAEDARELAELALAETADAAEVLSQGAISRNHEASVLTARVFLAGARLALEAARRLSSLPVIENALEQATRSLRAARQALVNQPTLPPTYRN